ncbi:MAG: enoyl-CoA hydratase/isomerase family protein [Candidatus Krumholzibacteriia bacterium]
MASIPDTRGVLRISDRERVRLLTFDRPDSLNAFNDDLYDAVRDALADATERRDIAVVVMTGAGRAFTAGQDLGEMEKPRRHDDGLAHGFPPFIATLSTFPKPLVAAVNGIGVGIGLTLLPHCDLVLMAEEARLRAPFARLGVTAEAGSTALLPALVGWQDAAHILYTATWIDAAQAARIGLAWRIHPARVLLDETLSVAAEIAAMPVDSLVATKKLLLEARHEAVRAALTREDSSFAALLGGPANREALAAFRERREPDFTRLAGEEG